MKRTTKYEMDMCSGPVLKKVLLFSMPLMLTSALQLLFNAADIVVVGRFAGSSALASVGATGALINLTINVLMGLAIGTSVLVARYSGANRPEDVKGTVHTSIAIAFYGGVGVGLLGVLISRPMLSVMGTPEDVVDGAALYIRIYFAGLPAMALYNFGSAVLRAVGDTRRPLYFLSIAGAVNVLLNLFCVIVLKLGVAGVAVATVVSQTVSALLVINCLRHSEGGTRLTLREARVDRARLREIVRIGLPAGIQGTVFSISNMIIQSSINSFGSTVMAGNAAAGNLEGFVSVTINAFYQAALTFTSQNIGARKPERVKKILLSCVGMVTVSGLVLGVVMYAAGMPLLGIYATDPEVIRWGFVRLTWVGTMYLFCGLMDTMVGMMRGLGYSLTPMLVTMLGVVGIRLGWIFTVFAANHTLETLYVSYPISWSATAAVHGVCFFFAYRKLMKRRFPADAENGGD